MLGLNYMVFEPFLSTFFFSALSTAPRYWRLWIFTKKSRYWRLWIFTKQSQYWRLWIFTKKSLYWRLWIFTQKSWYWRLWIFFHSSPVLKTLQIFCKITSTAKYPISGNWANFPPPSEQFSRKIRGGEVKSKFPWNFQYKIGACGGLENPYFLAWVLLTCFLKVTKKSRKLLFLCFRESRLLEVCASC